MKVKTADGRTLNHRTYVTRGTPGNPINADEVAAKMLDLVARVLGTARANESIAAVYKLDSFEPLFGLRRLLRA